MQNKLFEAIFDSKDSVFKIARPAESESAFRSQFGGNGEIVRLKDITEETPISLSHLEKTLQKANYGRTEIELIIALVQYNYKNTY